MSSRNACFTLIALILAVTANNARAESVSKEFRTLVPRQMLPLLHTPEIHRELKLTKEQVSKLETLFADIDGTWFQARILPPDQQLPILDGLDQKVHQWLAEHTSSEQQERLGQIELQAQSVRMLLREDLAEKLTLESAQQQQFAELARATAAAQMALQQALNQGKPSDEVQSKAAAAIKAENDAVRKILKAEQQKQLAQLLGEPFDLSRLKRIYPMAPELVPAKVWINSKPLTLKELRGKVVLVHFYAFQCHGCSRG